MSIDINSPVSDTVALAVPVSGTVTVSLISGTPIAVSIDSPTAANGIPAGGTTGQHLTKTSATNYDAEWTDAGYRHVQGSVSDTWIAVHNLGIYPGGVVVKRSDDLIVEGDIAYDSLNQVTLSFANAFSGEAYLS